MTTATLAIAGIGIFALAACFVGFFLFASLRRDRLTHRSAAWQSRSRRLSALGETLLNQRQLDLESKHLEGLVI